MRDDRAVVARTLRDGAEVVAHRRAADLAGRVAGQVDRCGEDGVGRACLLLGRLLLSRLLLGRLLRDGLGDGRLGRGLGHCGLLLGGHGPSSLRQRGLDRLRPGLDRLRRDLGRLRDPSPRRTPSTPDTVLPTSRNLRRTPATPPVHHAPPRRT